MICMPGWPAMPSLNPSVRSAVTDAPRLPSSSTILAVPFVFFASHSPARRPSSFRSEPTNTGCSDGSLTTTVRSEQMTGMWAAFIFRRIGSQPWASIGLRATTSSRCWRNASRASSCFCCTPWLSVKCRSTLAGPAASLIESVLAARQPLSAPSWLNPSDSLPSPAASCLPHPPAAATVTARGSRPDQTSTHRVSPPLRPISGPTAAVLLARLRPRARRPSPPAKPGVGPLPRVGVTVETAAATVKPASGQRLAARLAALDVVVVLRPVRVSRVCRRG